VSELMESLLGVAVGAGVGGEADGSGAAVAEGDAVAEGPLGAADGRPVFVRRSGAGEGELSCR
jgi:hypothetical protein